MSLVSSHRASMEISTNPGFSNPIPKWGIRKQPTPKKPHLPPASFSFLVHRIPVPAKLFSGTGTSIYDNELHRQLCPSPSPEKSPAPPMPKKPKNSNNQEQEQEQEQQQQKKKNKEVGGSRNVGENHLNRPRRRVTYKVAANMTELQQQREQQQQQKKKKTDDYSAEKNVFSISLSQQEIEEDFIAMTGRKPSLKPKKRIPKTIQRQIEEIFPGGSLADITLDSYKVK